MGTIADKLAHLAETKGLIRAAITSKGVEVPENATFRDYGSLIESISGGGGEIVTPPVGNARIILEREITQEDRETIEQLIPDPEGSPDWGYYKVFDAAPTMEQLLGGWICIEITTKERPGYGGLGQSVKLTEDRLLDDGGCLCVVHNDDVFAFSSHEGNELGYPPGFFVNKDVIVQAEAANGNRVRLILGPGA